jgi:hypothetical protein
MNAQASAAPTRPSPGVHASEARPSAAAARAALRQLNTRFAFTPWRRAMSATDAPGTTDSSTIRCLSSSDHERRDRLPPAEFNVEPAASRDVLNASCPPVEGFNVH